MTTHRHVNGDQAEPDDSDGVRPLRPLWPIPHRQEEAHHKQAEIQVLENVVEDMNSI